MEARKIDAVAVAHELGAQLAKRAPSTQWLKLGFDVQRGSSAYRQAGCLSNP